MKIVINGEELSLKEKEVEIAKQSINRFLGVIKEGSIENNMPTLYITLLAVMKTKATDLLNGLDLQQLRDTVELLKHE